MTRDRWYRKAERKAQRSTVKCRRCDLGAFRGVPSALVKRIEPAEKGGPADVFYVHAEPKVCTSVLNLRQAVVTEARRRTRSPKFLIRILARRAWRKLGQFAWQ